MASPASVRVSTSNLSPSQVPRGEWRSALNWARQDATSGFLVSLIALPLCLGIALASGFPPAAGLLTAVGGGLIATWFSNSELTIKGPAAGLIVIALGAVLELGDGDAARGYPLALGVGVVAGGAQIALGALRLGRLGELFPTSAVHGMLVAIGVLIASRQAYALLGVAPADSEPLALIAGLPRAALQLNPALAAIGLGSLGLLFGLPRVRASWARAVPAPLLVLLAAVAAGWALGLEREHAYRLLGREYALGPEQLLRMGEAPLRTLAFPDFSALRTPAGWKYVVMFALVGSLESLLSAKAIDLLDPWRRRADLNRDLLAIGVANTAVALCGGLPMISEIVRSSANVSSGARTRFANAYHALFLLLYALALAPLMSRVPLAALAAMLVYTGCRLASVREWVHMAKVGSEQLAIFATTLLATLLTDLLVGVGCGVLLKVAIHIGNGVPLRAFWRPALRVRALASGAVHLAVEDAAIFSNWLQLKQALLRHEAGALVLDLGSAAYVDHTVMSKLEELREELAGAGRSLQITGLDAHTSLSTHPLAARRRLLA
jgi:MFS superfamily sulfate permease-like transporter